MQRGDRSMRRQSGGKRRCLRKDRKDAKTQSDKRLNSLRLCLFASWRESLRTFVLRSISVCSVLRVAFLIGLCVILPGILYADTLVLNDGRRVSGDVVQIGGRYMVKTTAGSVTF